MIINNYYFIIMDSAAASLLLLFSFNFILLILVVISFGLVRRIRGDKAKVKLTPNLIKTSGEMSDLEALLLDPTRSKYFTDYYSSKGIF